MTPREQLSKYFTETQPAPDRKRVASGLGISLATLSLYLNEKYSGNVETIDKTVVDFFVKLAERIASAKSAPVHHFVMTAQSRRAWDLLRACHIDGEMGLIVGPPGVGKSETIKQYCKENRDASHLNILTTVNLRILLVSICKSLRVDSHGVNDYLARAVINGIKGSGRIIIVDEAQHLTPKCLEILRQIHDETGVGLVYVGGRDLVHKISILEQIASRIGHFEQILPLAERDIQLIAESRGVPISPEAVKKAAEVTEGSARRFDKVFRNACRLANGGEISVANIIAGNKRTLAR